MAPQKEYPRFSLAQRIEHWVMFVSFTLLAVTGLPQKFADWSIADSIIAIFGGIEGTRNIHHIAAAVLALASVYHIIVVAYKIFVLRVKWTMLPGLQDLWDGLDVIRYNLGKLKIHPKLPRYSFEEKVEYWAMVWGTIIMGLTGFMMWNPINTARFVPGDLIPTAKAAHGAEAILAVLAILVWHLYNVHLKTFNKTVFTGKLDRHQMEEEHGRELAELSTTALRVAPEAVKQRQRVFIPVAAVGAIVMLLAVVGLLTGEQTALATVPRRAQIQAFVPLTPTPTTAPTAAPTVAPTAVAAAPTNTTPSNTAVAPVSVSPKLLPASHEGRTTCTMCHANGLGTEMPADHTGWQDNVCLSCHKMGGAAPTVTTTPTKPAATMTSAATTSASSATAAPTKPAATTTSAATTSASSTTATPTKPAATTTSAATTSASSTTAAPTTVAAAPTNTTPSNTAVAPVSVSPKLLPASHEGRTTCTVCHANGLGTQMPADHAGWQDNVCLSCHKMGGAAPAVTTTPTKPAATTTSAATTSASSTTATPTKPAATTTSAATTSASSATAAPTTQASATQAAPMGKDVCLACHPFDTLSALPPKFTTDAGEKVNPHRYVPHDQKDAQAILDCANCHTKQHPLPPTAADIAALPKPNVDWCYAACHHQNNFTPCKACHQ